MMKYERDIIEILIVNSDLSQIDLPEYESDLELEFTECGYFLSFINRSLPSERLVLSVPQIHGLLGGIQVGFVAFVSNYEFTLECYTFHGDFSPKIRDKAFVPATDT